MSTTPSSTQPKAYVVTVDMGYGHLRAIHPLRHMAATPVGWDKSNGSVIIANNYRGIPQKDKRLWEGGRSVYEKISRLKPLPIIGRWAFGLMDYFQRVTPFYPKRDLTKPTAQLRQIYSLIDNGWGKHLIKQLNKQPLPLITSFFTTAFFADEHDYQGDIFCICTDTDISRAWAPRDPANSRIHYLAPNARVKERLQLYGVRADKITITGFPLPDSMIGEDSKILKHSIGRRLCVLDPNNIYREKYHDTIERYLGEPYCSMQDKRPLSITFAVGGAGAQREIGATILHSLHDQIHRGEVRLNLVAGSRNDVYRYYDNIVKQLHLNEVSPDQVHIIYDENKFAYFDQFNTILTQTDVLWTKPSELSFYAGLGLPIIIAPTVGSQEEYNKDWLLAVGAGISQKDPRYTHQWLFDWIKSGWLAEAAMQGLLDANHMGTAEIIATVFDGKRQDHIDTNVL